MGQLAQLRSSPAKSAGLGVVWAVRRLQNPSSVVDLLQQSHQPRLQTCSSTPLRPAPACRPWQMLCVSGCGGTGCRSPPMSCKP